MIQITGFYIIYNGDPSVGIYPMEWEVKGELSWDTKEEYDEFVEKQKEAWEYCSDTPVCIETFEERKQRMQEYDRIQNMFDGENDWRRD